MNLFFRLLAIRVGHIVGYLVAAEIEVSAEDELLLMSGLHGIGVISLDQDDPLEGSRIHIPCRERVEIDWDVASRLAKSNTDAHEYFSEVSIFYKSGYKPRKKMWDGYPDD